MKLNDVINKRFVELIEKATTVNNSRHSYSTGEGVDDGKYHEWITSAISLVQRVFGENSIHYQNLLNSYKSFHGYARDFEISNGIFQAAKDDYEGGYLFSTRALLKAEFSTDILEQATELLRVGYKDPACVLTGVALETTIKELCTRTGIPHSKLDAMNIELCKKEVYNMGMQKQITTWAHWRNKAAHGEWGEYKIEDVEDMIKGTTRFIAEYT